MKKIMLMMIIFAAFTLVVYAETVQIDGVVKDLDPEMIIYSSSSISGSNSIGGSVERLDSLTDALSASNYVEYEVVEPSFSAGYDLTDADGNPISSPTGNATLQIRSLGDRKVEFNINTDANLSEVIVDSDEGDTVVFHLSESSGVYGTHSLFIPYDNQAGVFVCPDASELSDVNISCSNLGSFSHSECQSGTQKSFSGLTLVCTIDGTDYKVSGLTGSGIGAMCDECNDCDEGLYCELRNSTPICQDRTANSPPACINCLDDDNDLSIDYAEDPGCISYDDDNEVDEGPSPGAIPEFSTVGIIFAMVIIALGVVIIKKKE